MPDLGPAELLIVLAIVVLVFGGSRLAEVGGSLGKGIKDFRKAMTDEDEVTPADRCQDHDYRHRARPYRPLCPSVGSSAASAAPPTLPAPASAPSAVPPSP